MRWFLVVAIGLLAGIFLGRHFTRPAVVSPTVVERLRAVSRLQVLDVTVSRKVTLSPEPVEKGTLTASVAQWVRYAVDPPSGTALVEAEAHFSIDLSRLDERSVHVRGDAVVIALPEPELSVELSPEASQVLASNLDSEQTHALLAKARRELSQSLARDPKLLERARESARQAVTALVQALGFRVVHFAGQPGELNSRRDTIGPRLRTG